MRSWTLIGKSGLWNDAQARAGILERIQRAGGDATWQSLERRARGLVDLADLALTEDASELEPELESEREIVEKALEDLETQAMLSGPHDGRSAIVSLQAGAGGVDSQDWAQMLVTMFRRWGDSHGHKVRILDWMDGDEAGIKRADLEIDGPNCTGT